ncbi:MAG: hypothetical protein Q4G39_03165 [Brachymonas sp.]|nr:hypothetical protein [Brachymonas sp.]
MRNILVGFVLGAATVTAVAWIIVVPQTRDSYRNVGYNDGRISAQSEIADQIDLALGSDLQATEAQKVLYNVKSSSVVIVDRNGVKTLRTVK